jgi:hypothetical protein
MGVPEMVRPNIYVTGETIVEDVSCDSKFMLNVMDNVGKAIRKAYSWVSAEERHYHFDHGWLDNVGGHGTA